MYCIICPHIKVLKYDLYYSFQKLYTVILLNSLISAYTPQTNKSSSTSLPLNNNLNTTGIKCSLVNIIYSILNRGSSPIFLNIWDHRYNTVANRRIVDLMEVILNVHKHKSMLWQYEHIK